MRGLIVVVVIAVAAACASGDGQDYSDRCVRMVIARSNEISEGPAGFVIAQQQIADEYDSCEWVDDNQGEP